MSAPARASVSATTAPMRLPPVMRQTFPRASMNTVQVYACRNCFRNAKPAALAVAPFAGKLGAQGWPASCLPSGFAPVLLQGAKGELRMRRALTLAVAGLLV